MIACDQTYIATPKSERQAHLKLVDQCVIRGADSIQCRGLLAYFLDTTVPADYKIVMAHACHNADCNNPEHLYWATRSENESDKYTSPDGARLRALHSSIKMGEKNNRFGMKPWLVANAHIDSWKNAHFIYTKYYAAGWDFSKYGQSNSYFQKKYGMAGGSCRTMVKMFKSGWVPSQDPDWQIQFNKI